jgi:hypothetical protein
MSPPGIPLFYGADDTETVLAEVQSTRPATTSTCMTCPPPASTVTIRSRTGSSDPVRVSAAAQAAPDVHRGR